MRKLIDLDTAIDALCRRCDLVAEDDEPCTEKCNDIKILEKLPSAQLELSMEIQEILNYLDTTLHPIVSPDNWYVYSELHDMVSRLLSTQLEIIDCADCKHWICHDRRCGFWNHGVKPLDWCCYAERRGK